MHFGILSIVCLFGTVITSPINLAAQDTSVVDAAIKKVDSALLRLNNGLKSRKPSGDSRDAQIETDKIMSLTNDVLGELWDGAKRIRQGPNVNAVETVVIIPTINSMTDKVRTVVDGWIDAKPMVAAGGKQGTVLNMLLDASQTAALFCDAIIGKLPGFDQPLAVGWKTPVVGHIERAITEYKRY
jgi:hypothetical protein